MPDGGTVRIVDLDGRFLANPYPLYAGLRREAPVQKGDLNGLEAWYVTRYEEASTALADRRLAKNPQLAMAALRQAGFVADEEQRSIGFGPNMLMSDPPDHTRLRRLVLKAFTPRRVERLRPRVQQIADGLLDAVAPSGRADLMEDLAYPLPVTVICALLGVPFADRTDFRAWTNAMLTTPSTPAGQELRASGARSLRQYFAELVARRRPDVDAGLPDDDQPDLTAALIAATDLGGRLDDQELLGMLALLLVAGHETTVNLIGNGMLALLGQPDQLALLRGRPELLGGAVEEMLRYDGPVQRATMRIATEDMDLGGVALPGGALVIVMIGSADRDADRFADPDRFDIQRVDNPHVAFGHGIHFCLGAPLARMEAQIAIGTLLERFPEIALDVAPEQLEWRGGFLRGLGALPVRLAAPAAAGR